MLFERPALPVLLGARLPDGVRLTPGHGGLVPGCGRRPLHAAITIRFANHLAQPESPARSRLLRNFRRRSSLTTPRGRLAVGASGLRRLGDHSCDQANVVSVDLLHIGLPSSINSTSCHRGAVGGAEGGGELDANIDAIVCATRSLTKSPRAAASLARMLAAFPACWGSANKLTTPRSCLALKVIASSLAETRSRRSPRSRASPNPARSGPPRSIDGSTPL